jgi:hypothetical protein
VARSFGKLTITSLKRGEVEQAARISGGLRHTLELAWDARNKLFVVTYLKTDGPVPVLQTMHWYEDVDLARARFDTTNRTF